MIATSHHPRDTHMLRIWVLIMVAGAIALGAMLQPLPRISSPLSEHAVLAHGDDAVTAKQCLDGEDGWIFYNPASGRFAFVCWLQDKWGIVILSITLTVITAFFTKRLRTIKNVRDYLRRQGYEEL